MKKDVLVVKNITREGPGLLEGVLAQANIGYDLANLDAGDAFPDPTGYKAVIVLGGPDSANDANTKMAQELDQLRAIFDKGIPYLGICLGLQVAVKAAGGKVVSGSVKEIGFLDGKERPYAVKLTDLGQKDPLFKGLDDTLKVFQLHGETVELTGEMQLLATGEACTNQVVKVANKAYGIQSHFELTQEMLAIWAEKDPDLKPIGKDTLLKQFEAVQADYTKTGQTLMRNFLGIAGLA